MIEDERNYPNRDTLFTGVKNVLNEYEGIAVTDRQIHYRLVAAGVYPNTFKSYHNLLVPALVKWRREGLIDIDAIEDRTRRLLLHESGIFYNKPISRLKIRLQDALTSARDFEFATWYRQPYKVIIGVEKQAMEGPFAQVCYDLDVDLAVLRGYSSLSYTNEIAKHINRQNDRKVIIIYFGDLDPSGMNIPETLERDLNETFDCTFTLNRVALTHEQVDELQLLPAPVKKGDTRAKKFIKEHGEDVYELDAIEPRTLQNIIRTHITKYYNEDIHRQNLEESAKARKRIESVIKDNDIETMINKLPYD